MFGFLNKIPYGSYRLKRALFILLTTFVCYVLFGFFAFPAILKNVTESRLEEFLARKSSVREVRFNPLTLQLEVEGLRVDKKQGDGAFVSMGRLVVGPAISSIWELAAVVKPLEITDLYVDISFYGKGQYSISDLMVSSDTPKEPKKDDESDEGFFPFALYGMALNNATLIFDDQPRGKRHVVSQINLNIPFTSSLMAFRQEFTQPKFSAVVNGDFIELDGRTLPFHNTLRTEFQFGAKEIDLRQYWRYLPVDTSLDLAQGTFTSNLSLTFERPGDSALKLFLNGGGALKNIKLSHKDDGTVFSAESFDFKMEKFSLGDSELVITDVEMNRPFVKAIRRKDGTISWQKYFFGAEEQATEAAVVQAEKDAAESVKQSGEGNGTDADEARPVQAKEDGFLANIKNFVIADGQLEWVDLAVPGEFRRTFGPLHLKAAEISTAADKSLQCEVTLGQERERFSLAGAATLFPVSANATITGENVVLTEFLPYYGHLLPLELRDGTVEFNIDAWVSRNVENVILNKGSLTLRSLKMALPKAKEPCMTLDSLGVTGVKLDLNGRSVRIDEVALLAPEVRAELGKKGLDLANAFAAASSDDNVAQPDDAPAADKERPWIASVDDIVLDKGKITFVDSTLKKRNTMQLRDMAVQVEDFTTAPGNWFNYTFKTAWSGGGLIRTSGKSLLQGPRAEGRFRLAKFGLKPLDPYLGAHTELLLADGSTDVDVTYDFKGGDKPVVVVKGVAGLDSLKLMDNSGRGEFMGLESLDVAGVEFVSEPMNLKISEVTVNGPRAVLYVDKNGRLNARRVFRIPEPEPEDDAPKANSKKSDDKKAAAKKAPAAEPAKPVAAQSDSPFHGLDIGRLLVKNGRVTFDDDSVSPQFATKVTDIEVYLDQVTMDAAARPKLDVRAKIGPTPLSVTGALNPLITPMYSNLTIALNGMELVPLTPYTIKNLAYPVQKGRLYADVIFKTEDWVLDASNKLFIQGLVMGDKVKFEGAPNIPVKLGLALLQDGNGDMEINLPISGRLDDPNFRVGGIVFKAIIGLVVKAVASPFSLIGSIFGGGGENLDFVVFEPGQSNIAESSKAKLNTMVKALTSRPKLRLEVDGTFDANADKQGLMRNTFSELMKKAKYDSLTRKQRAATTAEAMAVGLDEYEDVLYEAYKEYPVDEDQKPTTLFMVDRQPVEVMEAFIMDRIQITDADLAELALARAKSVKQYLIDAEPALAERVFLLDKPDSKGKTGVPAHRADLGLK